MIGGQTLSKPKDFARPAPCRVPALTTRRVMTAPATVPRNLVNEAAPAVDSALVRFSHIGDRPYPKHQLVRTSDGVRLAVCDTGPRTAEHTVVFLHGLCLNHTSWERQVTSLLRRHGRSVRVVSYDHRGHGRSAGAPISSLRRSIRYCPAVYCVLIVLCLSARHIALPVD